MNIVEKFKHWKRKQRWNRQYKKGRWENLKSDKESGRYKTIVEYSERYGNKNPDILDLGSGEGVLLDYFNSDLISSFDGMDFSSVSIKKANKANRAKGTFTCEIFMILNQKLITILLFLMKLFTISTKLKSRK